MLVAALLTLLALALAPAAGAQQPELGPCSQRPRAVHGELYVDFWRWCVESVVHERDIEPLSFTALAIGDDGALYASLPRSGRVVVIRDSDGDGMPDAMRDFVAGLTLPNGLAFHAGALYVVGGQHVYRVSQSGGVEILVDDLPQGAGFWNGGIAIQDDRLFVSTGAPCRNCAFDAPERGAILRMNLDGGEREVFATGFRDPAALVFFRDKLWTVDSAPRQSGRRALDELNRVEGGGWHGYPQCLGAGIANEASSPVDCGESVKPAMLFGNGARPTSLAFYPYATLPGTKDSLIVVLRGEPSQIDFVGFKALMLSFDAEDQPIGATILIPYSPDSGRHAYQPYPGGDPYWEKFIHLSEQGKGFYPQQPLAVAVNDRGWIYISITGGRIIALRPVDELRAPTDLYPVWTPMNADFDPSKKPTQ